MNVYQNNGLKLIWHFKNLLWATTVSDIRKRYTGTLLGMFWMVFYPILFLAMYAVVYTLILRIRVQHYSTFHYVLLIFAGLIPFLGFSEALGSGVSCVTENKNLIKNTLFPIELIPVKSVFVSSLTMCVGLIILLMVLWPMRVVYMTQLMIPVLLLLQLIFTIGVIWILSALNVFFQDVNQVIGLFILLLMLVSPIGYTMDMIPHKLMPLMYVNPLFYLIMLYRESIMQGTVPVSLLLVFTVMSFTMFFLGFALFSRLKGVFSDYV